MLLILIGIVSGVAITIPVTISFLADQKSGETTPSHTPNKLVLREMSENLYGIGIESNIPPLITVRLSEPNQISKIMIFDRDMNMFTFIDNDRNGRWNRWFYDSKSESYGYNQQSGFPDSASILSENIANDNLVRIDGEYFPVTLSDEKAFVEMNSKQIEVEEFHKGLYRIKQ